MVNKVISSFRDSLQSEKKALSNLRSYLKLENSKMVKDVVLKSVKLQEELTTKAKVLDALAEKTAKISTKNMKIKSLNEHINTLTSKKAIFNSSLSDVIAFLKKVIETNDCVLTPFVRHHLVDKLNPVFLLLKQLVSILGSNPIPKQGGDEEKKKR